MTRARKFFLSILSGVLLVCSWPEIGWVPLIFLALVPLLLLEEELYRMAGSYNNLQLFGYSWLTFLIWNVGATWWVVNASWGGALLAFVANSLLMAGVFTLFHASRRRLRLPGAIWILPVFWLGFEYFHHDWDLSWPWLTLGNAFAGLHQLVQWYEFTGSSGGSLWILIINTLITRLLADYSSKTSVQGAFSRGRTIVLALLIPMGISLAIYFSIPEKGNSIKVAIVQPNVDPYNEKFSEGLRNQQLEKFIALAERVTDHSTRWLLGPETALAGSIDERFLGEDPRLLRLREFVEGFPDLTLLIGAETHTVYEPGMKIPATARKIRSAEGFYYDAFNTALMINRTGIQVYHKSKLVPGVEQMPFPGLFKHIEALAIDMGGTTGTLGTQTERSVLRGSGSGKAAPAICYESVFGDFLRAYTAAGANFIAIITNDGWWGDTPGYRQHLAYARLRAIENRRSIARSANTGVSCFLNQRGDILQPQPYWQEAAIVGNIQLNEGKTLFAITGDVLGRSMLYLSFLLMAWSYYGRWKKQEAANRR